MDVCPICKKVLDGSTPTVKLRAKGCEGINKASLERKQDISVTRGQVVHVECRRDYIHHRNTTIATSSSDITSDEKPATRSCFSFDFKNKCLFCGQGVKLSRGKHSIDAYPVRTFDFQDAIKQKCIDRNDEWSHDVMGRLALAIDLPAADAVYHQSCNVNFRTLRNIPNCFSDSEASSRKRTPGRPTSIDTSEAFQAVLRYMEDNVDTVLTLTELVKVMEDICGDRAYSKVHLNKKLKDHFGDQISISTLAGKESKITWTPTSSTIIHEFYKTNAGITQDEHKQNIIMTAGKLIKADIADIESNKINYPSFDTVASVQENTAFIPESLRLFLSSVCQKANEVKLAAIGQAIIQACRPKGMIAPLQIGLGVQLHHHFGSRFLIDTLSSLGFTVSYSEVQRFESNAAAAINTTIPDFFPGKFVQFVADNVDHNIRTLDGQNTFHGMGIIACTTPGSTVCTSIPRVEVSIDELTKIGKVNIKYYNYPAQRAHNAICFRELEKLGDIDSATGDSFDTFSKVIWPMKTLRPSWGGFMHMYDKGKSGQNMPMKSSVTFLPMIDMNPSDLSCINSVLHFVCEQALKYDVTPVLTFDQPLFQKATQIISHSESGSQLNQIVLRLGGFHTEMSFLGSIGYIMSGSGLQEVLETVYASNAVAHMMSGKAITRAIRGHFLVDTALHALLLSTMPDTELQPELAAEQQMLANVNSHSVIDIAANSSGHEHVNMSSVTEPEVDNQQQTMTQLAKLYEGLLEDSVSRDEVCKSEALRDVSKQLAAAKSALQKSRTGCLWIQYMEMVEILQQFIRAERTGDWLGHLHTLQKMLPYFAASGHSLYLKSAYIYLQNMLKIEADHPEVYQQFIAGNHSLKRSNKHWAGLSTDLMIEQVLMRSLKTTGGLTRGRGMSEAQRSLWLMSMPANAEMNNAMQHVSNTEYATSEQHKDVGKARSARDSKDTKQVLTFLLQRSPFDETDTALRNIETGVTAGDKVNVDKAKEIGEGIVEDMVGKSSEEYTFKRSRQVITLNDKNTVKVTGETVEIDPQLLFQRLTAVADRQVEDISTLFMYELSSLPSALFESNGLPRVPQKSSLADAIWVLGDCRLSNEEEQSDAQTCYVVGGGSLLQKIPWQKNKTFGDICQQYHNYLKKYTNVTVVFDGYSHEPSTKDVTHYRRGKGIVGTEVKFTYNTPFKSKKDVFLKNLNNKQNFITLLGEFLTSIGIDIRYASSDADTLIVNVALELAATQNTFIIGEDTDLLVLLCYYVRQDSKQIIFRSDSRQTAVNRNKIWDIQKTQNVLSREICDLLLFFHAMTGCDTTSRIYGIGKTSALKCIREKPKLREVAKHFIESSAQHDVAKFGELAVILFIDSDFTESLDTARFKKFSSKVMTNTSFVQVHTLPPTSAALRFHSLRVFYQIQVWKGSEELRPEDWGWEVVSGMFMPVKTSLPPAPESLLNIIRCKCKANCDSKRCTCRKHGLLCSVACGACRGVGCSNSPTLAELHIEELGENCCDE